jgi:ABC-type Mn2+/Zn2+ transport system ATPase subunit
MTEYDPCAEHPVTDAVVAASRLDIGYKNEIIVPEIEFQLGAGRRLSLIGINGSGKSTLLKTLVGLIPPLKGELTVFGTVPGKTPRRIAYLSQFHSAGFILPIRAVDAVRMGRYANHGLLGRMTSADDDLVMQAMERMGIAHLANASLRSLSGGQQQRVYLAQVLARRADLLVLDEPTAGLDAGGSEAYQQAMQAKLARGASVVVATHDLQEAMTCDQAMLLAHRVIAFGKGKDILTQEALVEAFGIVISVDNRERAVTVVEREHGHDHGHDEHPIFK